jgi:ABC-type lipoprotein release transport system permease subunit
MPDPSRGSPSRADWAEHPSVFVLAPALMFPVAVLAALRPALRAAGVDPARALRAE